MRVRVYFDDELDKDIIAQMPSWAKGAWVRERLKHALNNESLLNEQKVISVLEKYLEQKNVIPSGIENHQVPHGSTLANSPSRSSEEIISEETTETTYSLQQNRQDTGTTWRMPE